MRYERPCSRSARRSGSLGRAACARRPRASSRSTIVTQGGAAACFQVEVARNDADRAQGLMYRRSMPADRGHAVRFRPGRAGRDVDAEHLPAARHAVHPAGRRASRRIAADTEPLSTRTIPSGEPVLAVLELNAGTAARLGDQGGRPGRAPAVQAVGPVSLADRSAIMVANLRSGG